MFKSWILNVGVNWISFMLAIVFIVLCYNLASLPDFFDISWSKLSHGKRTIILDNDTLIEYMQDSRIPSMKWINEIFTFTVLSLIINSSLFFVYKKESFIAILILGIITLLQIIAVLYDYGTGQGELFFHKQGDFFKTSDYSIVFAISVVLTLLSPFLISTIKFYKKYFEINNVKIVLNDLNGLKEKGLLTNEEFEIKSKDIKSKFKLNEFDNHSTKKALENAYNKGLLNKIEFETKLNEFKVIFFKE